MLRVVGPLLLSLAACSLYQVDATPSDARGAGSAIDAAADSSRDVRVDGPVAPPGDAQSFQGLVQQVHGANSDTTELEIAFAATAPTDLLVFVGAARTGTLDPNPATISGCGAWSREIAQHAYDGVEVWYVDVTQPCTQIVVTCGSACAGGPTEMWGEVSEWSSAVAVAEHGASSGGMNEPAMVGTFPATGSDLLIFATTADSGAFDAPYPSTWDTLEPVSNSTAIGTLTEQVWARYASAGESEYSGAVGSGSDWDGALVEFAAH